MCILEEIQTSQVNEKEKVLDCITTPPMKVCRYVQGGATDQRVATTATSRSALASIATHHKCHHRVRRGACVAVAKNVVSMAVHTKQVVEDCSISVCVCEFVCKFRWMWGGCRVGCT